MSEEKKTTTPSLKAAVENNVPMSEELRRQMKDFLNNEPGRRSAMLAAKLGDIMKRNEGKLKPEMVSFYKEMETALTYAAGAELFIERLNRTVSDLRVLAKVYREQFVETEARLRKYEGMEQIKAFAAAQNLATEAYHTYSFNNPESSGI